MNTSRYVSTTWIFLIVSLVSFIKIQVKIFSLCVLYLAISEGKVDNLDVNHLSRNHAQEEKDHHKDDPNLSNCSLHKLRAEDFKAVFM